MQEDRSVTSIQETGSNNLRTAPIMESKEGIRMMDKEAWWYLALLSCMGENMQSLELDEERNPLSQEPYELHRSCINNHLSRFSLYYIPLVDSSHDTSWGPERQLSCENDS